MGRRAFHHGPQTLPASELAADYKPNVENAKSSSRLASAYMTPGHDRTQLAGGLKMALPFGVLHAEYLQRQGTWHRRWTEVQFVNAKRGTGKNGEHLYPAFPLRVLPAR